MNWLPRADLVAKKGALDLKTKKGKYWTQVEQINALRTFRYASVHIPAYKNFLNKNNTDPSKIKSFADFKNVPPTDKKNYLQQYSLQELQDASSPSTPTIFTSTSGSTGNPFYFPRSCQLDWQSSLVHEQFLKNSSFKKNHRTLVIVGFGMGVWIGGLITYKAFEIASLRSKNPVALLTPGINKTEIFKALKYLAPHYEEIILAGYPPFLKDILDEAPDYDIDFSKMHLRLLMAAETFSETFRDYIAEKAYIKNIYTDTINIYGSADIGTMAYETPLTILLRRLTLSNESLGTKLFGTSQKLPTYAQYNPQYICFEPHHEEILLTGNSVIPLIRYAIGDNGTVKPYDEVVSILKEHNINITDETEKKQITEYTQHLPFINIFERKDFSTTLYGLQIYPEIIREALLMATPRQFVTGKFNIVTKFDQKQNQYLEINLELKKNIKINKNNRVKILNHIVKNLHEKNGEYKELSRFLKKRAIPKLFFWPSGHSAYFKEGVKQKWTTNQ